MLGSSSSSAGNHRQQWSEEIERLRADILYGPILLDERMNLMNQILADFLRVSNAEQREELLDFLERWKVRVLLVEAAAQGTASNEGTNSS